MMDQAAINFLVKLSLACIFLSLAIFKTADCRAIQSDQGQYSAGTGSEINSASVSADANQIYTYQHQPVQQQQPQEYAQPQSHVTQQNYQQQYYDQPQQQQHQPEQNYQYQSFGSGGNGNGNKRKQSRRSILNSIMAPFMAMREQGVNMLSASLQGCQPNAFSLWCRFWSMFIRR